ncbi:hypothetical protein P12x_000719 [Tundrisphaera lichenicola]|uniref:hypothetical protein n=1 Tax=Tundrisphaera lichenicola TaxID=2029860 RepID=UPI003EB7BC57
MPTKMTRNPSLTMYRFLPGLAILALTTLPGCYQEPNRFDKVQEETRRNVPAVSKEALPGSEFNKMFPKPEGDFDVVYSQEKTGFAQANLVKKGEDVATLSISDTLSNPEAADKYKETQDTFEGYPIVEIGNQGTGLLVGSRFQIQIRSKDANFSKFDREDWLKKFDLANLAKLQ